MTEAEIINHSVQTQREEAYQIAQAKARQQELARWLTHVRPIADVLRERNYNVTLSDDRYSFIVNGVDCRYLIEINNEYSGSSWRRTATGKLRLTFGDYGDRQSYKQKNDGTFSYDKIADKIESYVVHKANIANATARRSVNKTVVAEFRKLADVTEYGWFGVSDDLQKPVQVNINLNRSMSVDEAFKFVEALKVVGIKPY